MSNNTVIITKEQWIKMAIEVIESGVELMTDDQLRQWSGVRAVLELSDLVIEDGDNEHN